jgi:ADP-ribosyl-[dinitrogen reductase] hydrolase
MNESDAELPNTTRDQARSVKTSATNPLEIKTVTPEGTQGLIGMTLCPGRKGTSVAFGRWDRDLAIDLDAVRAWMPDLAIALLEDHEFPRLGIARFRQDVAESGVPWEFAPIVDGGVPDAEFELAWRELGPRVRSILRAGGRVLIHCRAGLGRTGLLAATLLIELGAEPETAIAEVRRARPGAIENCAQKTYVLSRRPVPPGSE